MLSRLVLHPLSRDVGAYVRDAQRLHQFVLSAFGATDGGSARSKHGVLHRLEVDPRVGSLVLYVQSEQAPDWSRVPSGTLAQLDDANPAVRSLDLMFNELAVGMSLRFRLRANVTRCVGVPPAGRIRGPRVPLRSDDARRAWLMRKGKDAGFDVDADSVLVVDEGKSTGNRAGRRITFEGVRFDGSLRISDAERFRTALCGGIGPAKAYGFGLLSIARS